MQLFGKLDELTNQLTSDEPKENVDASPAMLARQEQLRDAILSASGQMQKESRTLLEELGKVGSSQVCVYTAMSIVLYLVLYFTFGKGIFRLMLVMWGLDFFYNHLDIRIVPLKTTFAFAVVLLQSKRGFNPQFDCSETSSAAAKNCSFTEVNFHQLNLHFDQGKTEPRYRTLYLNP